MQECILREVKDPSFHPIFVSIYWPSIAYPTHASDELVLPLQLLPSSNMSNLYPDEFGSDDIIVSRDDSEVTDEKEELERRDSPSSPEFADKVRFIDMYRAAIDPDGTHASRYPQDFARLYDILIQSQSELPTASTEEFVRILRHYRIDNPHKETLEENDIFSQPELVAANVHTDITNEGTIGHPLLDILRAFTFWNMKSRAAIVGQQGVAHFLSQVKTLSRQHQHSLRLHLFGHSFGAKLVSAAVYNLAQTYQEEAPIVDTLVLLLGAFSQFAFSSDIPIKHGGVGRYSSLVGRKLVATPIAAVYSCHDLANKELYPLGMRLAKSKLVYEIGDPNDRFGALGANGAQGLNPSDWQIIELLSLEATYNLESRKHLAGLNIDGQHFINADRNKRPVGAHRDIYHPEIFHLALALARL